MNIAFVCNQNLARSRVLVAFFSKLLPVCHFSSFGKIAQDGRANAGIVDSILRKWELNDLSQSAKSVSAHLDEILTYDLVFAVSEIVSQFIQEIGFKGMIVNLESEALELGIHLWDPQLVSRSKTEFELAKYLKVSYTCLVNQGLLKPFKFTSLIPFNESSTEEIMSMVMKGKSPKTYLYADLIAPLKFPLPTSDVSVSTYSFNENLQIFDFPQFGQGSEVRVLVPKHQISRPQACYLSPAWFAFLTTIDSDDLLLISPPLNKTHGVVPESYLSSLAAREIQVID